MDNTQDKREKKDKSADIIVNGRKKTVEKGELLFDEVVNLAFDNPPTGENIVFTVVYRKGPDSHKEGTLTPGQTVKVKDGMVFDVTATDKS